MSDLDKLIRFIYQWGNPHTFQGSWKVENDKIVEWNFPVKQPTEKEVLDRRTDYDDYIKNGDAREDRRMEYPDIGDQLDYIYKALKHLKDNNVDIGTDGEKWVTIITDIKNKYPIE